MVHRHHILLAQFLWTILLLAGTTSRLPAQEQTLGSVSEDDPGQAKTAEVVSLPEITGKTTPTAELQAPGLEQLLSHLEAFRKAHTPFHIRHREVIKLRNASEVKALESMGLPPGWLLDTEYESAFWDNRSWKRCLSRGVDGEPASDKRSRGDCDGTAGLDVPFALLGVFIEPKPENCKLTFDDIFPHITITSDEHKDHIELWMFPVSGHWIPKRLRSSPEDKDELGVEWEVHHIKAFGKDRPPQIIDGEVRWTVRNGDQETTITSEFFITKALYGDDVVPGEIDPSMAPMPAAAVAPVVDAQVMNTPAASNGPQLRARSPKVIVIETTPDIDRSEVIRKVVEAMETDGRAKRGDIERAGKPVGLEAILSPVHGMSHEKIIRFIEVLQSLGVERMRFSANNEQKESTVIIQCPPDIAWRKVRTMTEELEKTGDFKVDVRVAASDEPVTPVAVESLPNANRVPTILPGAEELPPPSNLRDGASLAPLRPAIETSERDEVKVFALQNIQANEAGRIIEQLYIKTPGGHDSIAIRLSVDDHNNSLIVRGDSAVIAEVEALLLRLDTKQSEPNPADSSNATGGDDAGIRVNVPAIGPEPLALDFSVPVSSAQGQMFSFSVGVPEQNADDLQRQYDALEQRARSLSDQLRKPLPDPATGETLKSQLRDTVRQAFETRQNLQRAELAVFARRLKGIQESIESRDKISQQIIDRRFEELLDPDLKWDSPETSSSVKTLALGSDSIPSSHEKATPDGSRRSAAIPKTHLQLDVSPRTPIQDEKAISKLVLTFFQDRSRRAVPCVVVKINEEFFAVTTSPATVVPNGTPHAIDRSVVEWSDGSKATVTYDERSTKELQLYRFADDAVIPEPMRSAAEINSHAIPAVGFDARLEVGVPLFALTPVGAGSLSETRVRVSAINVSQKLTLPAHEVEHHYDGLFAVDVALPEGTPIFLDGKLMGLTLLGSRFVGEEARQSYVLPTSRLWELCN